MYKEYIIWSHTYEYVQLPEECSAYSRYFRVPVKENNYNITVANITEEKPIRCIWVMVYTFLSALLTGSQNHMRLRSISSKVDSYMYRFDKVGIWHKPLLGTDHVLLVLTGAQHKKERTFEKSSDGRKNVSSRTQKSMLPHETWWWFFFQRQ